MPRRSNCRLGSALDDRVCGAIGRRAALQLAVPRPGWSLSLDVTSIPPACTPTSRQAHPLRQGGRPERRPSARPEPRSPTWLPHADYQIGGHGWLNAIPPSGDPRRGDGGRVGHGAAGSPRACAGSRTPCADDGQRVIRVMGDPVGATAEPDGSLFPLDRLGAGFAAGPSRPLREGPWRPGPPATLARLLDAFGSLTAMGVSASALIDVRTTQPTAATVRDLQSALRAQCAEDTWLTAITARSMTTSAASSGTRWSLRSCTGCRPTQGRHTSTPPTSSSSTS